MKEIKAQVIKHQIKRQIELSFEESDMCVSRYLGIGEYVAAANAITVGSKLLNVVFKDAIQVC